MKRIFYTILFALAVFSVSAQEATSDELGKRLSALESENGRIRERLFSMPKVSGFINIPYDYAVLPGGETSSSSFNIKRARLKITGQVARKIEYCMQADFAGTPKLVDAYVKYKFKPWLGFQVGQSKTIFSLENKVYVPLVLETIEYTNSSNALAGSADVSGMKSTGRDVGVSAFGAFLHRDGYDILEYAVAVYNGNGINAKDNNKSKDFAAGININPCKSLTVAASAYFGQFGKEYYHRDRYSIALKYEDSRLHFRTEYLYGSTGSANGTFETQGGYAVLGYWMLPCLRPIVRYDVLQRDTESAVLQNEYLVGLDYWPVKKHLRLQVNYTYTDYSSINYKNMHKLAVMLTAAF